MAWRRLDAACFDKILAMILAIVTSFRHLLGWAVSALQFRGDLILENLLSVGNCWLCTPNNLAVE